MRIRQIVFVARDLAASRAALGQLLALPEPYRDPGVAEFGLDNAVFCFGDQFIEVISPVQEGTAGGRHLARHGDSPYMLILQTDDLARERARLHGLGVRSVWNADFPDISATHLHPKDVGAAIVSIDAPRPAASWRWGGPDWRVAAGDAGRQRVRGLTVAAHRPEALADRWANLFDRPLPQQHGEAWRVRLTDGFVDMVAAPPDGHEGITGFTLEVADPAAVLARARGLGLAVEAERVRWLGATLTIRPLAPAPTPPTPAEPPGPHQPRADGPAARPCCAALQHGSAAPPGGLAPRRHRRPPSRGSIVAMPAAPRARPEDHFTPAEWQRLGQRSRWRGPWLVAHCWGVIGLAMLAAARWPWLTPLAVAVIGTRQLGLFILMHDAAHGLLHPNRRLNDWMGHWLCSSTLRDYRPYHLQHHRYVQQPEDPDLVLSAPFPITRASLARKLWRDLSGQTFWKQRVQPALARWRAGRPAARPPDGRGGGASGAATAAGHGAPGSSPFARDAQEVARDRRFWLGQALGFAAFAAAGQAWVWLALWALPMVSWLPMVTRIRNIAEHALVGVGQADPLRQARTTRANWLERAFIAPYWVNYHNEHHLFTSLPCWQLPKAHALLAAKGTTACMAVETGYRQVLRLATAAG